MRAAYSEMLRQIQLEGLYRAEEQENWRAGRRAEYQKEQASAAKPAAPAQGDGDGAEERADAGWSKEDVVECRGCWYWRMLDYTLELRACWYPLLENRLRPCLPADCYRKPGTPYRPCVPQGADGWGEPERDYGRREEDKEGLE